MPSAPRRSREDWPANVRNLCPALLRCRSKNLYESGCALLAAAIAFSSRFYIVQPLMCFARTRPASVRLRKCSLRIGAVTLSFSAISIPQTAVLDQVSVDLRQEMRAHVIQPPQDLDAAFIRQGLEHDRDVN